MEQNKQHGPLFPGNKTEAERDEGTCISHTVNDEL